MKCKLICVGKTSEAYLREGIGQYMERLKHFVAFEMTELPDVKVSANTSPVILKEREAEAVLKHIYSGDVVVLLDENGKTFTSKEFASFLEKNTLQSVKNLVFVVGGAFGFSEKLTARAHHKLSLSKMTYTHQMVRLIFVEQLYRGFTIIKNLPYHNP